MSYFDHFAAEPGTPLGQWIKRRTRYNALRRITPLIPDPAAAILEIGPGWGELALCFREAGYCNYTTVEPNQTMREHLTGKGFVTKNYLIPNIAEPDLSYDAIVLADVFEHLSSMDEAQRFIAEAYRVLRVGGILCIMSPDYLHWKAEFFNCDFSHSNVTSVRRLIQLFYANALQTVSHEYYSGFIMGRAATLVSYIVRAALFFVKGNAMDSKLYKLKVTFLRQFVVIARKGLQPTSSADHYGEPR
jgi:SAM-dependent methyltransferase